jgi:hypothetical protein
MSVPAVSISSSTMIAAAADVADDVHQLGPVEVPDPPLLDDREGGRALGEGPGPLGEARSVTTTVSSGAFGGSSSRHVDRGQLVDRDVEEALDLAWWRSIVRTGRRRRT